jgi:hypothetical protein
LLSSNVIVICRRRRDVSVLHELQGVSKGSVLIMAYITRQTKNGEAGATA